MSRITQYVRHLAVVAIATLLAQCAWAEVTTSKVISFNFSDQSGSNAADTSGVYNVAAGAWNNFSSSGRTRTGDLNMWNGSQSVNAGSNFSITWSGSGWWGCGATDPIQKRYLDDGKATTITVSNIPFEAYDVYIICSTDQGAGGKFTPWTVNGAVYGDAAGWGDTASLSACTIGENTLKIAKQAGTLSIVGSVRSGNNRGCIAALQIVEAVAVVVDKNVGSAYTATEAEALEGDIFNLTFEAGGVLTIDKNLTRQYNLISEGAITIIGSDESVVAANLSRLNAAGVVGGATAIFTAMPQGTPSAGIIYRVNADLSEGTTMSSGAYSFSNALITNDPGAAGVIHVKEGDVVKITRNGQNDSRTSVSLDIEGGSVTLGKDDGHASMWYGVGGTTYDQKGGTVTVTATSKTLGGNGNGFLVGWSGAHSRFNVSGGDLLVADSYFTFWSSSTALKLSGTGHIKTKGVYNGSGSGHSVTISENGVFELGSLGWSTVPLTMNGGTLKAYENTTMGGAITLGGAATVEVPADVVFQITGSVSGSGSITKTGAGVLDMKSNRPTMDVQAGKVKLSATSAEVAAGYIDVPVVSVPTEPSTDKVIVVNGEGDEITVSNVAVVEGENTIRLTLQVNKAITEGGNISELAEGMAGSVLVYGDNEAETPIVITFDTIPEAVTEVVLSGTVQIAGTLTEKVKFGDDATIITTDDCTIANTSSGAKFRVDAGTLKMTGTSPAMITVNAGATFDVNGVPDIHYPITLNGGTLKNGGAEIGIGKQQWKSVTLTADSFVETDTEFGMIAGSYGAITFQTNGYKLTKKGTGNYIFANVTFANGGALEVLEGSIEIAKGTSLTSSTALSGTGIVRLSGVSTIDRGVGTPIQTVHYVVVSETNTLKLRKDGNGQASEDMCQNDSMTSPLVTINSGATLNFNIKDFSGWSGNVNQYGWIVNNGTLNINENEGTRYFRNHIVTAPGATTTINGTTDGRDLKLYGGNDDAAKAQLYVPAPTGANTTATMNGETTVTVHGATAVTVETGATLDIVNVVAGSAALAKYGDGVLKISNSSSTYSGAVSLKAGSIVSAKTLTVNCGNPNMKLVTSTEEGVTTYSLAQRDATDIYLTYANSAYGYVLADGTAVTPVANDVIVVDSAKYTDNWHVGEYTALPDMTGHTLKLVSEMNFKGGGFAANQTVVVNASVYLYGNIGAGAAISGSGTLYLGHDADTVIGDGVEIACGVGFQGTNKATINGAVTISGTITIGNGLFKLAEDATLTCAELADGKVVSGVEGYEAKYSEGKYTLVEESTGPDPIDPTEPKSYDTEAEANAAAEAINANKTELIAKPFETMTDAQKAVYDALVTAKVVGNAVIIDFGETGAMTARDSADNALEAADILDTEKTAATVDAIPGFYYAIIGGTDVSAITTSGTAVQATGSKVTLAKPDLGTTNSGFYKVQVSVTAPTRAAE